MSVPARLDILIVNQFFTPEMGAPAARFQDFGRLLVERGHRVQIITGFPNSPSGIIPEVYRGRLRQRETIDGVEVSRGWIYASPRLSSWTKSAGFVSFALSASLWSAFGRFSSDVVISTSPPPSVGIPGMIAARRLGVPMVFDVRDIWPEAIAESGRLRSPRLIRILETIEKNIYERAAAITVVTDGKRERLIEKGVPAEKIRVVPNGVDLSRFEDIPQDRTAVLRELGLDPGGFVVVYAGIFNPPQGLDVLLEAAKILQADEHAAATPIQFALVGDGSERARLAQRVQNEGLSHVVQLVPEQPRERIPAILSAASAIAVTLRKRRDTHTVPSKIYESMASGRPVLVSADGAPAQILLESRSGLASPAEDAPGLVQAILTLTRDPAEAVAMGQRGRQHAIRYDRRVLVERLEEVLYSVADAGSTAP